MADTWKAYTDTQALKELAGLRGIAPSVRFLEKRPQGASKEKIYHVRQNELVYLWGVEMFQGGTDCITIDMINSDGSFTPYKSGDIGNSRSISSANLMCLLYPLL
jgi:hypothetical protein